MMVILIVSINIVARHLVYEIFLRHTRKISRSRGFENRQSIYMILFIHSFKIMNEITRTRILLRIKKIILNSWDAKHPKEKNVF